MRINIYSVEFSIGFGSVNIISWKNTSNSWGIVTLSLNSEANLMTTIRDSHTANVTLELYQ